MKRNTINVSLTDSSWSFSSGDIVLFVVGVFSLGIQLGVYLTSIVPPNIPLSYMILSVNIPVVIRIFQMILPTLRKAIYGRE